MKIVCGEIRKWNRYQNQNRGLTIDIAIADRKSNMKFINVGIKLDRKRKILKDEIDQMYQLCNEFLTAHINEFDEPRQLSLVDKMERQINAHRWLEMPDGEVDYIKYQWNILTTFKFLPPKEEN